MNRCRIVLFAKAPKAGQVKTRLIPELGAERASRLASRLLQDTLKTLSATDGLSLELCGSPAPDDPAWSSLAVPAEIFQSEQGSGDLGQRLARAASRVIAGGENVLLIGSDCPLLSSSLLSECADALTSHDSVLIPAMDGGYVLLGLRRFHESLFTDIAWSTAAVAATTRQRIAQLGWSMREWPALRDIDEAADLAYFPQLLQGI